MRGRIAAGTRLAAGERARRLHGVAGEVGTARTAEHCLVEDRGLVARAVYRDVDLGPIRTGGDRTPLVAEYRDDLDRSAAEFRAQVRGIEDPEVLDGCEKFGVATVYYMISRTFLLIFSATTTWETVKDA